MFNVNFKLKRPFSKDNEEERDDGELIKGIIIGTVATLMVCAAVKALRPKGPNIIFVTK